MYIAKYADGQASHDGVFVFEWLVPSDTDNFKVTEVKYNYYQLMNQEDLNTITKANYSNCFYYPYKYISTEYILKTDSEGVEEIKQYETKQRGENEVYRSNAINLGYETYYNKDDELVSQRVTQTGLYIITRTISIYDDNGNAQTSQFSYAFFVDRNKIKDVQSLAKEIALAVFTSFTQGVLVAGASVYANQLYLQAKKDE